MKQELTDLLCTFGDTIGLPDPEKMARGAPFDVNGFTFAFGEQAKEEATSILLFVDFGPIQDDDQAAVYHSILRENYLEFPTRNGSYCVSSLTGNVVCARALAIAGLTVDTLTATISQLVLQAACWQREHGDGHEKIAPAPMRRPAFILPMPVRPMITY